MQTKVVAYRRWSLTGGGHLLEVRQQGVLTLISNNNWTKGPTIRLLRGGGGGVGDFEKKYPASAYA